MMRFRHWDIPARVMMLYRFRLLPQTPVYRVQGDMLLLVAGDDRARFRRR